MACQLFAFLHHRQPVADDLDDAQARAAGDARSTSASRMPIAYKMRVKSRYQRWVTTILVVPITLGTVLIAEGMLTYFGPKGWLSQFLQFFHLYDRADPPDAQLLGRADLAGDLGVPFRLPADPVVHHRHRPGARARSLDAGRRSEVAIPAHLSAAARPGLAMCFCLAFVQAFSVFPSAVLLGSPAGPTRVISIAAYEAAFEQYDYSLASAIAMIMGFVQLIIVAAVLGTAQPVLSRPGFRRQRLDCMNRTLASDWFDRAWRGLLLGTDDAVRRQHRADDRRGRHQLVCASAGSEHGCRKDGRRPGTSRRGRSSSSTRVLVGDGGGRVRGRRCWRC